ncbi:MAG: hypothetical protein PHG65_09445, partial [Kiritimatiellae bacterium]|nr:hypothetical protein [Kiritimatiellia bacterium]
MITYLLRAITCATFVFWAGLNARADGFAFSRLAVEEQSAEYSVSIGLNGASGTTFRILLSGSAQEGTDFRLSTNAVTFGEEEAADIELTILPEGVIEGPESILLTLTNAAGGAPESPLLAITLRDADSFSIAAANLSSQTSASETCYRPAAGRLFEGVAPDVVAIQEFNVTNNGDYSSRRDFVDQHFGTNFYYYAETNRLYPNGVISRWPILEAGTWNDVELYDREFVWATIDLPGERRLNVVSVHIKAGSTEDDITRRINEARQLTNYIATTFSSTNYTALCGDFNLVDRSEPTLTVLTNLFPYTRTPKDQYGYKNTSRNRETPFDWVMPNPLLDAHSTTTHVDGTAFPDGAIFDSRMWTTPPHPILTNDSLETGIQHMLVLRAFAFTQTSSPPDTASIAQYTFNGTSGGTNSASQTDPGVTASAFTTDDGTFSYLTGETSDYAIRDTGWTADLYSHYFTFTISITAGYQANLSALSFSALRGGTGPTRWAVRSSLDDFSNDLAEGERPL